MIKQIIFDLDGTLLNSLEDLADCTNYILRKYQYPEHPLDAYKYFVGDGIRKLIERAIPENVRTSENITLVFNDFIDYYSIHKTDKTAPYPGIIETLEFLQNQKIAIGVASNKADHLMYPLMQHYFPTILFAAILGKREGIAEKPNPQIIFDIMAKTGIAQSQTIYAGDTATDVATAKNSGLRCIGVLWGFRDRNELTKAGADYIIENPLELIDIIHTAE